MSRLRVALAQVNTVVGDLTGNAGRIAGRIGEAGREGCDLVVFPELAITGYPPEDLLLRPAFLHDAGRALGVAAAATADHPGLVAVIGFPEVGAAPQSGEVEVFNAAAVCTEGRVRATYRKQRLPNYSVFDEQRYFTPGSDRPLLWEIAGVPVGLAVCEDAWVADGPVRRLGEGGAGVVVHVNASPFHVGKDLERREMLAARAAESGCPQVYVNLVGGQDELVFDGGSLVVDADGALVHRSPSFVEDLAIVDLDVDGRSAATDPLGVVELTASSAAGSRPTLAGRVDERPEGPAEMYDALVLGVRDYVDKNGFDAVVVSLSGGIDSTLVATIAADALGPQRVHGVALPSRYSSDHSIADARELADRLGIDFRVIPIEPAHAALGDMLAPSFTPEGGDPPTDAELGLTGENLQSRIRAVVVMALSNRFGWLVLTTSNKSESAVGYSTLYGDSAGGLAVIKDVPKVDVYRLCRHRNDAAVATGAVPPIPEDVIDKPPSAELRPDQRDDQSLPPYEDLDPLLAGYVERDRSLADLVDAGHDPDVVARIVRLVDLAEYKRRQAPPGIRVTTRAFGRDRRLPITNAYRQGHDPAAR